MYRVFLAHAGNVHAYAAAGFYFGPGGHHRYSCLRCAPAKGSENERCAGLRAHARAFGDNIESNRDADAKRRFFANRLFFRHVTSRRSRACKTISSIWHDSPSRLLANFGDDGLALLFRLCRFPCQTQDFRCMRRGQSLEQGLAAFLELEFHFFRIKRVQGIQAHDAAIG